MKKLHLDFNNQTIYNSGENGYIKFQLNQQTGAVLSIAHTQEVIVVPC